MTSNNIVPFGKYKDRPVEDMLADTNYIEWLQGQPWFAEKYAVIYNIIHSAGGEPAETPEHNALQAQFLNVNIWKKIFIEKFSDILREKVISHIEYRVNIFYPVRIKENADKLRKYTQKLDDYTRAKTKWEDAPQYERDYSMGLISVEDVLVKRELDGIVDYYYLRQPGEAPTVYVDEEKNLTEGLANWTKGLASVKNDEVDLASKINVKLENVTFEQGWDVVGKLLIEISGAYFEMNYTIYVEIKPSVGDDYPAILRQMSKYKQKEDPWNSRGLLYTKEISTKFVSEDDVMKIFETSGFRVFVDKDN